MKNEKIDKITPSHNIIVFDMDGTLYELDGEQKTFKNSTLFRTVIMNSIEFVIQREGCRREVAESLITKGLKDTIGISNVLSKRYGITRSNYFDIAWNIDPKTIIKNFKHAIMVLDKLNKNGKRLFLLTGAPRIWMENVLNELNVDSLFERKFHGEMFGSKKEIFEKLALEFKPNTILSVGDQFETDLKPAQELGIETFQIINAKDILKLL